MAEVDDEGAEILANSLKHNTTLSCMNLQNNRIDRRGLQALLKLLNDVSSVDSTYNSNHTLRSLELWDTESLPELWDTENVRSRQFFFSTGDLSQLRFKWIRLV